MLTTRSRLQLLAFLVIAVLGIAYLGVRYVGVGRWFGASGYHVTVDLASSGGVFPQAEVTYHGVTVGRVGNLRLTRDGVQARLDITSDRRIPTDVQAVVADRSVIGEQYLDLRPRTDKGPYLADGSTIHRGDTALPPPVQELLLSSDRFAGSVPVGALNTVVDEFYLATQGAGQNLQSLITTSKSFFATADEMLPQTTDLVQTSGTVLATQQRTSDSIRAFSANLATIGRQLRASNGDISKVLKKTAPALTETNGLIDNVSGSVHGLLTNLLTTSQVFLANRDGLREIYVKLPVAVTDAGAVITPSGINTGLVPTFFDPQPCVDGYGGTDVRSGLDTTANPPLNTSAGCRMSPTSGSDIRGSQNAPGSR